MKVLVVDDSAFMRKVITKMVDSDPDLTVVGTAFDGLNALKRIEQLNPDVITLDVNMPRMDGLTTLQKIMEKRSPIPVVMVSATTKEGAEITFRALKLGAVDYIQKPSGQISLNMGTVQAELVEKIKTAAQANIVTHEHETYSPIKIVEGDTEKIITIGASTGGPPAVEEVLVHLPENTPPILIVQHMPEGFTKLFAERLDKLCSFQVKEAEKGDVIEQGLALIAPAGQHMRVSRNGRVTLDKGPTQYGVRPAVDPMMKTAAKVYQNQVIGVILTGMGRDGSGGMHTIKEHGGKTIAQNQKTCTVYGMPKAAIDEGNADKILPLTKIPKQIIQWC